MQTYPFTIDSHLRLRIDPKVVDLLNVANALHISSIASCTENDSNLSRGVDIMRGNQCSGRVID